MSNTDLEDMAKDDRCWDGNWSVAGLSGMFMELDSSDFVEMQMEEFEDDQEIAGGKLLKQHEFISLDLDGDEEAFVRLHMQVIKPRKLHVADGVLRRIAEGNYPPQIRIKTLSKEEMDDMLEQKQKGNEAFSKKNYEEAITHYDAALAFADNLYIGHQEQVEQVINILSNQAECYLRLKRYKDAGQAATDALLFDNSHEKSRMRRAKAELAIAGTPYLVQAQVDLEEIVNENNSKAGVKQAKDYLEQIKEILAMEEKKFKKQKTGSDWDFYVRMLRSRCW